MAEIKSLRMGFKIINCNECNKYNEGYADSLRELEERLNVSGVFKELPEEFGDCEYEVGYNSALFRVREKLEELIGYMVGENYESMGCT